MIWFARYRFGSRAALSMGSKVFFDVDINGKPAVSVMIADMCLNVSINCTKGFADL